MNDIRLTGICKSFGDKTVLKDLNLTLPSGRVTCVMAPSGGGKTTLMHIILGLLPPDRGSITGLDGHRIAAVFQEDRLIDTMDPVSNIRLVRPSLSRDAVLDEMQRIGLTDCATQPVSELSGGMRRRVALLRALLSDWDFLLMDEPFKGLDEETRRLTIQETCRLSTGKTVLLITHDADEADMMHALITHLPAISESGNPDL
ncbi:MAG: ATP-binding cassette domain-containing protein [Clostridia bacterium]|nr:ATP-binding cassette domain-containing protein [Clostridia bacterium]